MRIDHDHIRTELEPIAAVHGVELVAVEWLQGPGRGVLRLYIDRPGGDPRTAATQKGEGATADLCAAVSRDAGPVLDGMDVFEMPYDLEVSSPGFERPVQKRADFDRFAGMVLKVKTRVPIEGRGSFEGALAGTVEGPGGAWAVRMDVGGHELELDARKIARAMLAEIKTPKPAKPGKAPKGKR